jgi:hypothetical protein
MIWKEKSQDDSEQQVYACIITLFTDKSRQNSNSAPAAAQDALPRRPYWRRSVAPLLVPWLGRLAEAPLLTRILLFLCGKAPLLTRALLRSLEVSARSLEVSARSLEVSARSLEDADTTRIVFAFWIRKRLVAGLPKRYEPEPL